MSNGNQVLDQVKYVGGLIYNSTGRLLLERRSAAVTHYPCCWSIPGGLVECGETSAAAAARELFEETGLRLSNISGYVDIPRAIGIHRFYLGKTDTGSPEICEPEFTEALEWFLPDQLPEDTLLESLLAVAMTERQPCEILGDFATSVDQLFSSLFYSRLFPYLRDFWPDHSASQVLFHTIRETPGRKFKACVPYLLAGCHPSALVPSLLTEILFSTFYVLDDICDRKTNRYGHQTAFGAFGAHGSAYFLLTLERQIIEWCRRMGEAAVAGAAVRMPSLIEQVASEQLRRSRVELDYDLFMYEERAAARTAFVGDLWQHATYAAGSAVEAAVVAEIYPRCAIVGQIKNDLKDVGACGGESTFEDVARGLVTAPTIILYNRMTEADRAHFLRNIWRCGDAEIEAHQVELSRFYADYAVIGALTERCLGYIAKIKAIVDRAPIAEEKKIVLRAWIALQFDNGLLPSSHQVDVAWPSVLRAIMSLTL